MAGLDEEYNSLNVDTMVPSMDLSAFYPHLSRHSINKLG
jgi:hypothetical protein